MDFFKEKSSLKNKKNKETWKVLIVDDEKDVHQLTRSVLKDFEYQDKGLEFLSAYNSKEALSILKENSDIVLVLLDVVMETDDAGLIVAKKIREEFGNEIIQIVLRTGQPSEIPEDKILKEYEINDYKEKTELTSKKLKITLLSAIRSYNSLSQLKKRQKEIQKLNYELTEIFDVFDETVISFKIDKNGKIIHVSNAYLKISLKRKDDLIGKDHEVLISEHMSDNFYENLWHTLEKGEIWKGEIKEVNTEGKTYWLYMIITPKYDKDGDFLNYTATAHDITSQKEIEEANKEIEFLNNEIVETQKEVVFRIGAIAETRSKETGMHVRRVAEYSKLFALYSGLDEKEAEILKQASPMHDIGKVGIPDNILNKPGKHTAEEFEIMKSHAQIGYDMLKHSKKAILKTAAIVSREHHEKYNGTGYPRGLKGEDIHIYGRITAIADVFDALGSDRCYKKAWKDEDIFKLFKEERGKHFDPKLVDIFFENLSSFLKIRDTFKD